MAMRMSTRAQLPGFESQLHYLIALWPQISNLISLCCNFLIYKLEITIVPISQRLLQVLNALICVKGLEKCLVLRKNLINDKDSHGALSKD